MSEAIVEEPRFQLKRPFRRSGRGMSSSGRPKEDKGKTQPSLRPLTEGIEVEASSALIDQLELRVQWGYIVGDEEDYQRFRGLLCVAPETMREDSSASMYGRIFGNEDHNGEGISRIWSRKKKVYVDKQWLEKPLLNSTLSTSVTGKGERSIYRLSSYMHINPSRSLNHHIPSTWARKNGNPLARSLSSSEPVLKSLDNNDNCIPEEHFVGDMSGKMRTIINTNILATHSEIFRAQRPMRHLIPNLDFHKVEYSLRCAEIYWEFEHETPHAFLEKLIPLVNSLQKECNIKTHRSDCSEQGQMYNARTVTLRISKGVTVKIYAKLNNRLRFEVELSPKNSDHVLEDGYGCASLNELHQKLEELKVKAAQQINGLLRAIDEHIDYLPLEVANSYEYHIAWRALIGDDRDSHSLLMFLCQQGSFQNGASASKKWQKYIRKAKSKGLLRCHPFGKRTVAQLPQELTNRISEGNQLGHLTKTQSVLSEIENPLFTRVLESNRGILASPPMLLFS